MRGARLPRTAAGPAQPPGPRSSPASRARGPARRRACSRVPGRVRSIGAQDRLHPKTHVTRVEIRHGARCRSAGQARMCVGLASRRNTSRSVSAGCFVRTRARAVVARGRGDVDALAIEARSGGRCGDLQGTRDPGLYAALRARRTGRELCRHRSPPRFAVATTRVDGSTDAASGPLAEAVMREAQPSTAAREAHHAARTPVRWVRAVSARIVTTRTSWSTSTRWPYKPDRCR